MATQIKGFIPDVDKLQEVQNMEDGDAWSVDVTGWDAVLFRCEQDVDVAINGATSKTMRFEGQVTHTLYLLPGSTAALKFINNSGSTGELRIWGM